MCNKWEYNERYLEWTCWALGWVDHFCGGWDYDTRTVYIGPLRLVFLR